MNGVDVLLQAAPTREKHSAIAALQVFMSRVDVGFQTIGAGKGVSTYLTFEFFVNGGFMTIELALASERRSAFRACESFVNGFDVEIQIVFCIEIRAAIRAFVLIVNLFHVEL